MLLQHRFRVTGVQSPPREPQAESRQVHKSLQDFSSTQTVKSLLGIQRLVEAASPCPSPSPTSPKKHSKSPQLQQRQEQALFKGAVWCVWVSALPLAQPCHPYLCWQDNSFGRHGAGTHLAPLQAHQARTGLCCGHGVPWEGGSLAQVPKDVQDVLTPSGNLLP